ncbi:disulfide bond formation protein B [Pusillimonas minor]|uniref:Disulfide bond formation protein B n=1 Tax=Pusillimonas minor TaxID=2697024 RepID=A0A842HMC6_9BURK|nr:disulfide bond formation protein B [Pusillimonas minor]MBC2769406.1 disulfide bond formation protein B [Pusillimonas minor]
MLASRTLLRLIALLSVLAVAIALVSQHYFDMRPCAWCVFQRVIFIAIAVVAWLGSLGKGPGMLHKLSALITLLLSLGGVLAAWYQYTVAAKLFSCDLTFADRFMAQSGLEAAVPWLFGIYATCADARVHLLGVEYAIWALGLLVTLALISVFVVLRRR